MELDKLELTKKEQEGVWFPYRDASFLVCSTNKPAYRRALQEKMKPHRKQLRRELVPQAELDKLTMDAFAEHVLVGWKGLTEKGVEIPYSKERALELLTKYPKLWETVVEFSLDVAAFDDDVATEGVENAKNV